MANNTTLNPGAAGDVIATEDIGGVKYEKVKLIDSTAGSSIPVGTAGNPLRVDPTGTTSQIITNANLDAALSTRATEVTLALIKAKTDNLDALLSTRATEATLALIKAKTDNIPAQGQALGAASTPVVLTAAQITTLTPPAAIAGFALEAGHLATLDANTPTLGQKAMAGSAPVVVANDQVLPVSATSLPLPANAALETGGNLATMTVILQRLDQVLELLKQQLAVASAMQLQMTHMTGVMLDPAEFMDRQSLQ